MQRRTLVMFVGENWFFNHVSSLFEKLSDKYTSENQPSGILSLFKKSKLSHYNDNQPQEIVPDLHEYLHDDQSIDAFNAPLDEDTELKMYVVGHGCSGCHSLASLDKSKAMIFRINVQMLASRLHALFNQIKVAPTAASPIKISLIVCGGAMNHPTRGNSFAIRLLEELSLLGHNHIMVKAYENRVVAIFDKLTLGKIVHFYLIDKKIYRIDKQLDLRKQVLKILKYNNASVDSTDYLNECINQFTAMGFSKNDQLAFLQAILAEKKLPQGIATQMQELHQKYGKY